MRLLSKIVAICVLIDACILEVIEVCSGRVREMSGCDTPTQAQCTAMFGAILGVATMLNSTMEYAELGSIAFASFGYLLAVALKEQAAHFESRTSRGRNPWRIEMFHYRISVLGMMVAYPYLSALLSLTHDKMSEILGQMSVVCMFVLPLYILSIDEPPPRIRLARQNS